MAEGWIKLHRQIASHWIWEDPEKFRAWVDLLLMVNHDDKAILFNGKLITVKRGQVITSIGKLAERWKWSRERVYRYLNMLESDEMITKDSNSYRTLLTIAKYEDFQGYGNSNKSGDKLGIETSDESSGETQTRRKEVKNEKNNIYRGFENKKISATGSKTYQNFAQNDYDFEELEREMTKNG